MTLVSSTPLLKKARNEGYGVMSINVDNLEMIQAVIEAAEYSQSPIILQTTESAINYLGLQNMAAIVKNEAFKKTIPVALHLDHGQNYNLAMQCLKEGYSSIMIDASDYSFKENVKKTKEVVQVANALGVNVEAELGRVGGVEDAIKVDEKDTFLAHPDDCKKFVDLTGVSSLAPAIGTAHGFYQSEPDIDFSRIEKIASLVDVPLVLHGGTGIPEKQIQKAISIGMSKINLGTQVKHSFFNSVKNFSNENPNTNDIRKSLSKAKKDLKDIIINKIEMVGSKGKA